MQPGTRISFGINKVLSYLILSHLMCVWRHVGHGSGYPEEVVEGEDGEVSLVLHVQQFENVLQSRRFLPVLQSQHKVQVGLVVLGGGGTGTETGTENQRKRRDGGGGQ